MTSIRKTKKRLKRELAETEKMLFTVYLLPPNLPRLLLIDTLKSEIDNITNELAHLHRTDNASNDETSKTISM